MKLSSYQKLKSRCEYLQSQVDVFKNALTVKTQYEYTKTIYDKDGYANMYYNVYYDIKKNKIEEEAREKLQFWVAENLDKKTIMYLLKLKEACDKNDVEEMIKCSSQKSALPKVTSKPKAYTVKEWLKKYEQ